MYMVPGSQVVQYCGRSRKSKLGHGRATELMTLVRYSLWIGTYYQAGTRYDTWYGTKYAAMGVRFYDLPVLNVRTVFIHKF